MTRHEVSVSCDLAGEQVVDAVRRLSEDYADSPQTLTVHPYGKHLAQYLLYKVGWGRLPVLVDPTLGEDAWCLTGGQHEIYSGGG